MNDQAQQAIADASMAAVGHKAAIAGGGTTVASWLVSSQFGVVMGIVIGVTGLAMQLYFNRRRDRREQAEHEMRMSAGKGNT